LTYLTNERPFLLTGHILKNHFLWIRVQPQLNAPFGVDVTGISSDPIGEIGSYPGEHSACAAPAIVQHAIVSLTRTRSPVLLTQKFQRSFTQNYQF
jgi:hypothetical protein